MTQTAVSALVPGQDSNSYNSRSRFATDSFDIDSSAPANSTDPASVANRDSNNNFFQSYSMNGLVGTAPPGAMYVRALYDYEADDRTSLSFHEGDVIQVITQLESGWWDGVINGVRGWFPSNYCQIITSPDEIPEIEQDGLAEQIEEETEEDTYDDDFDEDEESEQEDMAGMPMEGADNGDKSRADFWIPQATSDGRLFYYNTMTGESSMELPLESPSSVTESGPRDRMTLDMPEKTRPPPEMMARGFTQDEDDDSEANSASELEGENLMLASRGQLVRHSTTCVIGP